MTNSITIQPPRIPIISVRDFGAYGDGIHDDTAAIQAAINSVGAGTLLIPAGTYILRNTLVIPRTAHGIRIIGDGNRVTVLYNPDPADVGNSIIQIQAGTDGPPAVSGIRGCAIEHLCIMGGSTDSGKGIEIGYRYGGIYLNDLYLVSIGGDAVNGAAGYAIDAKLERVVVNTCYSSGFNFQASAVINTLSMNHCYANTCVDGFKVGNCATAELDNCMADNCSHYGYVLSGNVNCICCTAEKNTTEGFGIAGSGAMSFTGCKTTSQNASWVINAAAKVKLSACSITSPTGATVYLTSAATGGTIEECCNFPGEVTLEAGAKYFKMDTLFS